MEWYKIVETVEQISENEVASMSFEQTTIAMCVVEIERLNKRVNELVEKVTVLSQPLNVGHSQPLNGNDDDDNGIVFHNTEAFVRGKGYYPVCSKFGDSVLYSMREDRKLVLLSAAQIASIRK
mgnify:CR=1 FL=1